MKKITLFVFACIALCMSASAQFSFPTVAGPTNVAEGTAVTLNINDAGNSAAVPASSTSTYSSFSVSVDWTAGAGGPYSSEAELTVTTTAGDVFFGTATTGSAFDGNATTLTFDGDFAGLYDPATDGLLDLTLAQSWSGSDADWSNIVVTIFESPACPEPTALAVSGISSTMVDVSWTGASESSWEIVFQAPGTGVPTGAGTTISTNPYSATGLTPATDYEVYVRADCATDGYSEWTGPIEFSTLCDVFVPDYTQDFSTLTFSTIPNCWDEADSGDGTTGPGDLGAGSWGPDEFLNVGVGDGAYKINLWLASKSDWILSPQFDLTGGPFQVDFDFGIMDFGSSTVAGTLGSDDTVELYISADNGTTWTNLITFDNTSVVPPSGTQVVYDLTAYAGQIVQFGILGSEGTVDDPEDNDIFVDNFRVRAIPSCQEPTGLTLNTYTDTTAEIGWTPGGSETSWEVAVQPQGTGIPTGAGSAISSNPYTVTGLSPTTDYEIYIRADCGVDGFSTWIGPINFTTFNVPPPAPMGVACSSGGSTFIFTEDFESDPAPGWTGTAFTGSNGDWDITTGNGNSFGTGPFTSHSGLMHLEYEASGSSTNVAFAISPAIDLSTAVDEAELSFFMHAFGDDMGTLNVGVSDNPAGPFTVLYSWAGDYQTDDQDPWVPIGVSLDAYLGQVVYVSFSYGGSGSGFEGDMSIDYVRVETCGSFCIAPSNLAVANVGGQTADLSWLGNNGETSWEYVVQPAGTGEPTGNGVVTTTSAFTESGLNFSTDYEVYVRAICGPDYSVWAGPVNFSTTIQTDYTIDCSLGTPENINYCYGNNDQTYWLFTSTDGFPLEIVFNSGNLEGFWDDITIYDGPDNTSPILFNNNTDDQDDLAGLVIETTATSLYIEVDSDGSGSCQSSSFYIPWDFLVRCKTCVTQSATFTVRGECEPAPEYFVDVDITDMGDAVSLTLTDGVSTQTATATGIVSFGPYPSETPNVITVTNTDDASCEIQSNVMNFICPPPPNPCSVIYAGEDTSFCEGTSTNLTASYQIFGQDTNTYEINQLDTCPQPPSFGGEPTSVDIDDRWSDVIDLGFEFCFFGGTYDQVLIGSNGVISFDLSNADGFNGWNIDPGDTLPNSTNTSLADANIFGVAHDIDPSVCGDINYFVLGASPSRQFVVNYTDICHFSCNDLISSSQIILYESSNNIDVNIFNKPTCTTWNDGNAVVGVQNPAGTVAYTPPGRNTGVWEATDEFWRFSPSNGAPNFTVEWYEGDTQIGGSDTVTVSPTETTTYTAAITYTLCVGGTATITDDVVVEILPNPEPVAVQDTIVICEGVGVTLEVNVESDIPDTITYYWTYDGDDIQVGPDNTYVIPEGTSQFGDYIVTAIDGNGCYGDTIISVVQGAYPEIAPVDDMILKCINEEASLEVVISNSSELSDTVTVNWIIDGTVVQSSSDTTYTHGIGDAEAVITVEVVDDLSGCLTETEISVAYYENEYCVDIPQGLSPNGDDYNDCLILDHLEDRSDISKAVVFNRYGTKVYELNDYVDQWCGTDQDGEILPVGTYFYIIYFNSDREPITSWIYLNY